MHAFIVRPFGTKNGIDFDRVERELIRPALEQLNFSGGTTGEFIEQGAKVEVVEIHGNRVVVKKYIRN